MICARDVDHVGVAHVAAVDHVGHLHARAEFIGLHLDGKDGHLRGFHVGEDGGGHVGERARRKILEHETVPAAAARFEFVRDGGGNGFGHAIGNQRDLFFRLDAQTGEDRRACAGREIGGIVEGKQMGCGFKHGCCGTPEKLTGIQMRIP